MPRSQRRPKTRSVVPTATSKNLTRAINAAGARGLFIGFTALSCTYCTDSESAWSTYFLSRSHSLPDIVRIDTDEGTSVIDRYEATSLPSLVLAWRHRWTAYSLSLIHI